MHTVVLSRWGLYKEEKWKFLFGRSAELKFPHHTCHGGKTPRRRWGSMHQSHTRLSVNTQVFSDPNSALWDSFSQVVFLACVALNCNVAMQLYTQPLQQHFHIPECFLLINPVDHTLSGFWWLSFSQSVREMFGLIKVYNGRPML